MTNCVFCDNPCDNNSKSQATVRRNYQKAGYSKVDGNRLISFEEKTINIPICIKCHSMKKTYDKLKKKAFKKLVFTFFIFFIPLTLLAYFLTSYLVKEYSSFGRYHENMHLAGGVVVLFMIIIFILFNLKSLMSLHKYSGLFS